MAIELCCDGFVEDTTTKEDPCKDKECRGCGEAAQVMYSYPAHRGLTPEYWCNACDYDDNPNWY